MQDELKRLKKAVRDKCLECSGGATAEVELCGLEECPLFPFRTELWPSLFAAENAKTAARNACGKESSAAHPAAAQGQFKLF